jgi:hypothetical protein
MAAVHMAMVEPNSDARKSCFIPKLLGVFNAAIAIVLV